MPAPYTLYINPTSESRQFQVVHFGEGDNEGKLIIVYVELEEGTATNDLQAGQHDLLDVNMWDEDVAGDFSDVFQKAEIKIWVL